MGLRTLEHFVVFFSIVKNFEISSLVNGLLSLELYYVLKTQFKLFHSLYFNIYFHFVNW